MKKILVCLLAMLVSTPCFALIEEDEISAPMHYGIVPYAGFHMAYSQLSGKNALDSGFMGGIGFRFSREGYFFTPNMRLAAVVGLDKSPLTMWTYGFTVGGRLFPDADLFLGADVANFIAYTVDPTAIVRIGTNIDLGLSDFQIVIDGFYGVFTKTTNLTSSTQLLQNFPYLGFEVGLQIPIDF